MSDYVDEMQGYQEDTVNDLDTVYGTGSSSLYLSGKAGSRSRNDRLAATRYVHG